MAILGIVLTTTASISSKVTYLGDGLFDLFHLCLQVLLLLCITDLLLLVLLGLFMKFIQHRFDFRNASKSFFILFLQIIDRSDVFCVTLLFGGKLAFESFLR